MDRKSIPVACFAPPLTDEHIATYETMILTLPMPGAVRDAMRECMAPIKLWWELPESKRTDGVKLRLFHRTDPSKEREAKDVPIVPLEQDHAQQLYDLIPWDYELDAMAKLFETIPTEEKHLRDAAHHLLWYAKELNLDREPLTADRL